MKKTVTIFFITYFSWSALAQDATLIYKNNVSSTVTIETDIGLGSGFFIGENIIATNYHVIEGAIEAYCYTNNSSNKYKIAGFIAKDKSADLILLKVVELNRPAIKIASSPTMPGQKIYVIGSPKGLPATISDGIISGLRDFDGTRLIQITAPISPGSSGGPVLNSNGELIGVSVGQFTEGQNLNFAIPKSNLESLLNLKTEDPIPISTLFNKFGSFIDSRDGITYKTVIIGSQIWIAENLKATRFNDYSPIPYVPDNAVFGDFTSKPVWENLSTPGYCWYNNDPVTNKNTYGAIYNWYAVNTGKLCPLGWHVPTNREWEILEATLQKNEGSKLAGNAALWKDGNLKNNPDFGTSGFTALPGGSRARYGSYLGIGEDGKWWSSTKCSEDEAWLWIIFNWYWGIGNSGTELKYGSYVRCIKD